MSNWSCVGRVFAGFPVYSLLKCELIRYIGDVYRMLFINICVDQILFICDCVCQMVLLHVTLRWWSAEGKRRMLGVLFSTWTWGYLWSYTWVIDACCNIKRACVWSMRAASMPDLRRNKSCKWVENKQWNESHMRFEDLIGWEPNKKKLELLLHKLK